MKLVYIAYGNVSVFNSQVIALLNFYVNSEKVMDVILILGINYKTTTNDIVLNKLDNRIKIYFYKQYPQYFLIEKLTINSISQALKEIYNINDYIIHVRNDVLAHYVFKAFRKSGIKTNKMIADVRGAGLEQLTEFSKKSEIVLYLKKMQRKQVDRSLIKISNISVVSNSLKKYIIKKLEKNVDVRVNSCLSNKSFIYDKKERDLIRKELDIKHNEILLVLSTGGDNAWQNTRKTIDFLSKKSFKILNLSKTEIDNDNVITKFIPYKDMYKYLAAADAAVIWRGKSITNKVASPVKFSEYVCCGLPVITNDKIDLITDYLNQNDCGKIVTSIELINKANIYEMKQMDRNKISTKGQDDFGIEKIANQYIQFYNSVLVNN